MVKNKSNNQTNISLYLDDLRIPPKDRDWLVVRSYDEAIEWMNDNGCPQFISFDHDLGMILVGTKIVTQDYEAKSGYDVAKWIVQKDLDMSGEFIPADFKYAIHSSNPVGSKNIDMLLSNYLTKKRLGRL